MSGEKAIGVDFGGTSVKIGVVEGGDVIAEAQRIETQEFTTADPLIQQIAETVKKLQKDHKITAVGCGMPGFVDFPKGLVHTLTNVQGWTAVPLKAKLSALTSLPCIVENDANAMAYAEWKRGAGRGMRNLVALTLGTGVGGGIVVEGNFLRGAQSAAGELGQTSIHYSGRRGTYGNLGALEDYIGNREIAEDAKLRYQKAERPRSLKECNPKRLAEAARGGDEIALKVWEDVAAKLATALINCCYLLNPEGIIIGGGVAQAGPLLFRPLNQQLKAQLSPVFFQNLKVLPARFGNEAGMIGAAALALECAKSTSS